LNVLVDTSVWSLALRRTPPSSAPEVALLERCLGREEVIVTTGLVLQELLQGFEGPSQARRILERFSILPLLVPELEDHVQAAALRNRCRRRGLQVGTIDALLAQLAIRHRLELLTADRDFERMSHLCPLSLVRS
jgi:predicted nucleic acid-binding protein